jgi:hypothetical protein
MNRSVKLLAAVLLAFGALATAADAASSPTVATGSATSITQSSVQVRGTVNPNGAATTYQFQLGLTTQYGLLSPQKTATGTKPVAVKATFSNLLPGTTYHYRLVAHNRSGLSVGTDRSFKTKGNPPPEVATGPASQVTTTSALVTGVINPHGQSTTWMFQWGPGPGYIYQTFGGTVPAGSAPVTVAERLTTLASGTTIHYRIVAFHGSSIENKGLDASFITLPSPRPVPVIRATITPQRDRSRPYTFTTSGKVIGSSRFPSSLECVGNVTVRYLLGKRTVALSLVPLASNCTFSSKTTFRHKPGRGTRPAVEQLRVLIRFGGNGYVAPHTARARTVKLG